MDNKPVAPSSASTTMKSVTNVKDGSMSKARLKSNDLIPKGEDMKKEPGSSSRKPAPPGMLKKVESDRSSSAMVGKGTEKLHDDKNEDVNAANAKHERRKTK